MVIPRCKNVTSTRTSTPPFFSLLPNSLSPVKCVPLWICCEHCDRRLDDSNIHLHHREALLLDTNESTMSVIT